MTKYNPNFIDIPLNQNTVYVYTVRKLLQEALDKSLSKFTGTLVDLGCGEMPYRQYILDKNKKVKKYIGIDVNFNKVHQSVKPDLYWDGITIPLKNNSVDTLIATEFFEHIPNFENSLKEINRVLSKDGLLYFTVPFIWPLHETPYDEYRYTPYSLSRYLKNTGFKNIQVNLLGNHHAVLAQVMGIWSAITKNEMRTPIKAKLFTFIEKAIIFKIINKLIKMDQFVNKNEYHSGTFPTGYFGYATK